MKKDILAHFKEQNATSIGYQLYKLGWVEQSPGIYCKTVSTASELDAARSPLKLLGVI